MPPLIFFTPTSGPLYLGDAILDAAKSAIEMLLSDIIILAAPSRIGSRPLFLYGAGLLFLPAPVAAAIVVFSHPPRTLAEVAAAAATWE